MEEAARLGPSITAPTWVIAENQTGARGRRGKAWVNPTGNLAATLVFAPNCAPADAAQRSFLAANALLETLSLYASDANLKQKWPNDVLLNGGKIAGILLESSGQGGSVDWLSIGIGVNLAHVPEGVQDAAFAPVSLASETGSQVPASEFLAYLAAAYAAQEHTLATYGFDRIRAAWLANAARLGEDITAVTPKERITGIFDTIDKDGNLVLKTPKGVRVISAADIHF